MSKLTDYEITAFVAFVMSTLSSAWYAICSKAFAQAM